MPKKEDLFLDFKTALKHLQSDDAALAHADCRALSDPNKTELAAFAETWDALVVERRRQVAQMLVELAEENIEVNFGALFHHMLDDEDASVRATAIDGLWEDDDPALVKPLIHFLLHDEDPLVRATAADSLGRFMLLAEYGRLREKPYADSIYHALLETIENDIEELSVRCRAIEAIAYSSRERVGDVIATAYEDEEPDMRASAVAAMGHSADTHWSKFVIRELSSDDPKMRFEAARAAGELEAHAAIPHLIELLEDADRQVQAASVTALGQIGGKQAQAALQNTLQSDNEVLRELVDEALQELQFSSDPAFLLFDIQPDDDLELDGE